MGMKLVRGKWNACKISSSLTWSRNSWMVCVDRSFSISLKLFRSFICKFSDLEKTTYLSPQTMELPPHL